MNLGRIERLVWNLCRAFLVCALLAACRTDTDAGHPASTVRRSPTPRPTLPSVTRDLPPTWTPTFTPTPRPPTRTPRPSATPTITPTPDIARVCDEFSVFSAPTDGAAIHYAGRVAYAWRGAPPDSEIWLVIWHRASGEGLLARWPPQQAFNMTVEMAYLPDIGIYDWELSVHYEDYGDLCTVKGWFVRLTEAESPTMTPTPTPSPTTTPTAIPEVRGTAQS